MNWTPLKPVSVLLISQRLIFRVSYFWGIYIKSRDRVDGHFFVPKVYSYRWTLGLRLFFQPTPSTRSEGAATSKDSYQPILSSCLSGVSYPPLTGTCGLAPL